MSAILYEVIEQVACITLNRPDKFNAFNREMALLLQDKLDEAANDASIRAILLTGNGKAFCAGQDLGELLGDNPPGFDVILSQHYNPIIRRMREIAKPIVVAVNGVAAGAGANIALAGDVVVATQSAAFIQAFSKIGLIPDSGGTFFLPRLIGFQKASALMMLGDKVSATEAERLGMVYQVLPDETFIADSRKIADTLANMPTQGLALTKLALNQSMNNNLHQQLQVEDELQFQAAHTADYEEGVRAFVEKRKPLFTGK